MKRSEVVNAIGDMVLDYGWSEDRDYTRTAEDIVALIEKLGMLPPFTGDFEQQDIIDRWGMDTGERAMVRVMKNKWEPEDET